MLNVWRASRCLSQKCDVVFLKKFLACCKGGFVLIAFCTETSLAQSIRADTSLSTSVSSTDSLNFTISGGEVKGDNLFHSFDVFSVPEMGSARFDNPTDVVNIISRVTGGVSSVVDGLIQASSANLFLINPDGIIFEENARLDIGGSFVGTTAQQVEFADGGVGFSAIASSTSPPLLNVSAPAGLQLGSASREVRVNDAGYGVISAFPLRLDGSAGLRVEAGKTLALVGNGVVLNGGVIATPGGRVELGSVQQGTVLLPADSAMSDQWVLNYKEVQKFGDVELLSESLIETSDLLFSSMSPAPTGYGASGGSVQVQGRQVSILDGSVATIQNFGDQSSGDIRIQASDVLNLEGTDSTGEVHSGLVTTSFGQGKGGNINIDASRLYFTEGAEVTTGTFGPAISGDISVFAVDEVYFELNAAVDSESGRVFSTSYNSGDIGSIDVEVSAGQLTIEDSGIASQNAGSGIGGQVNVTAEKIVLTNAGSIASAALGTGPGGDVTVTADTIDVVGVDPNTFFPTTIAVSTTNSGSAGSLTIATQRLRLLDGGRVDASTFSTGNAGTVTVTATESVEVIGAVFGSINPSLISSGANKIDPALRGFFEAQGIIVPTLPSGDSGDVAIDTPSLTVADGAQVTVRNDGFGNAGLLTVDAETVRLIGNGSITASTRQGSGGNIRLDVQDVLLLRQGSQISAEAGNAGNGGNLFLASPVLVALENSDIVANAFEGAGGNIDVVAQGIVGTSFRDGLTDQSDITASSRFGVSGVVAVTTVEVDPGESVVALPENVVDVDRQVVAGCSASEQGQFVATGRGGFPSDPAVRIDENRPWNDLRGVARWGFSGSDQEVLEMFGAVVDDRNEIVEATSWLRSDRGDVLLVSLGEVSLSNLAEANCLQ